MKPYEHARNSAKRFGGAWKDYIAIHDFLDSSKACWPDMRHRAILHSALGVLLVEELFGATTASVDRSVKLSRVAEHHITEDMGKVPALTDYTDKLDVHEWMLKTVTPMDLLCKRFANKWGGHPDEYRTLLSFFELGSTGHDDRYRMALHHSFGTFVFERRYGTIYENSDGRAIPTRDIAEQYVIRTLGTLPSVGDWLQHLPMLNWLGGPKRKENTRIPGTEPAEVNVD